MTNTSKAIYVGHDIEGKAVELDFDKDNINFVLLAGHTGSGKSIFHNNLYKQLMAKYTPDEIGFVFMDMTRVDFPTTWSPYLFLPTISHSLTAIVVLLGLSELNTKKSIFVHIEEDNMVHEDGESLERAFDKLRLRPNIHVVYSTSRLNSTYFTTWLEKYIDCKVVFSVANYSMLLLGNSKAYQFTKPGERILAYNDKQIHCQPFTEEERVGLEEFAFNDQQQ